MTKVRCCHLIHIISPNLNHNQTQPCQPNNTTARSKQNKTEPMAIKIKIKPQVTVPNPQKPPPNRYPSHPIYLMALPQQPNSTLNTYFQRRTRKTMAQYSRHGTSTRTVHGTEDINFISAPDSPEGARRRTDLVRTLHRSAG